MKSSLRFCFYVVSFLAILSCFYIYDIFSKNDHNINSSLLNSVRVERHTNEEYSYLYPYTKCEEDNMGISWWSKKFHSKNKLVLICDPMQSENKRAYAQKTDSDFRCFFETGAKQKRFQFCEILNGYLYADEKDGMMKIELRNCKLSLSKFDLLLDRVPEHIDWGDFTSVLPFKEFIRVNPDMSHNKDFDNINRSVLYYTYHQQWFNKFSDNPWHAFSYLLNMFAIMQYKNDTQLGMNEYLIMGDSETFPLKNRYKIHQNLLSWLEPFFGNHILYQQPLQISSIFELPTISKDAVSTKYWKIDQIRFSPHGKNSLFWQYYKQWKKCTSNNTLYLRSPIVNAFQKQFQSYFDKKLLHQISEYLWLETVLNSYHFHIYFNHSFSPLQPMDYTSLRALLSTQREPKIPILFFNDRYEDINAGKEANRCIKNYKEILLNFIEIFSGIIVSGNCGKLPFETQYLLMKNTDIFVGGHGATFMLTLLMNSFNSNVDQNSTKYAFEILQYVQALESSFLQHYGTKISHINSGMNIKPLMVIHRNCYHFHKETHDHTSVYTPKKQFKVDAQSFIQAFKFGLEIKCNLQHFIPFFNFDLKKF